MTPLACPFCGSAPELHPQPPLNPRNGHAWAEVRCTAAICPAQPRVRDGQTDDRLGPDPAPYHEHAITRWNQRHG